MPKGNFKQHIKIKIGDLVTYRSIKELTQENYQQKIVVHGIGIVISIDEEYAKVYWIHAQAGIWVLREKLTTFKNLEDLNPRY